MILAVDVGNTNIVFGGISEGKTSFISRIGTDKNKTADVKEQMQKKNMT